MNLLLEIFFSVFFIFGLYCAAIETWKLIKNIYGYYKTKRRIDKEKKKR